MNEDHDGIVLLGNGERADIRAYRERSRHSCCMALNAAGRLNAADYRKAVIYTTLSPCAMYTGAILLYGIPTVVIGENRTFRGPEELLAGRGVELHLVDDTECFRIMQEFIREHPSLWNEDIGERQ